MEDAVEAAEVELVLGQVEALELDGARVLLLLRGIVVVGQAVDPDDVVPARAELLGEVRADEPGRAGDHKSHRGTIP